MLPLLGRCLRVSTPRIPSILQSPSLRRPPPPLLATQQRWGTMIRKRKKNKGGKPAETKNKRMLRLKGKAEKELDKKRKKAEARELALKSAFRLAPHEPRPDGLPLGTALALLRGWHAKAGIFVRGTAFQWAGETKVVALVRVVRNAGQVRPLRGKVQFPFPVVFGEGQRRRKEDGDKAEKKKKRMMVILAEGESVEQAEKAGFIVGTKDNLDEIVLLVSEGKALPFDQLVATEKTVSLFRPLGRILGPKGLMPNDKQGTIVHDFATHGTTPPPAASKMGKKGIEIKLQQRGTKDSLLRIVVGKFRQTDQEIESNLKALIKFITETTSQTQIPLELSLYSTVHPLLTISNPHLTQHSSPTHPDRSNPRSNTSFLVPVRGVRGVGHPRKLRPKSTVARWVADAEWAPAEGTAWMLGRYREGARVLRKKRDVYRWHINRTNEDRGFEQQLGFVRSGEPEWLKEHQMEHEKSIDAKKGPKKTPKKRKLVV